MRKIEQIARDLQSESIAENLPRWIEAIGIGGSYSKNDFDSYSDLDLFVIAEERIPPSTVADFLGDWMGPPEMKRGPVYVPNFGFSCTMVFTDLSVCQLNVNYHHTFEVEPIRAQTSVIFDRKGFFVDVIERSKLVVIDLSTTYREEFKYFWIRSLFALRSIQRGELWRATVYITEMRKAMLVIIELREGAYLQFAHKSHPSSRIEGKLETAATELHFSISSYSRNEISICLKECVRWFRVVANSMPYFQELDHRERSTAESIANTVLGEGS